MSAGQSRLLARLEAAIRAERDPVRAACLRAEWAVVQARQGRTDLARDEVAALRKEFEGRQTFELMTWICVVESLAAHYSNLGQDSLDRMKRALAMSTSAGLRRLKALAATALAHMELYRDAPEEMGRYLQIALPDLGYADSGTVARAYLAVAIATHWGGKFDLATPWYLAARKQAAANDDDVTLVALSRQMSAIRAVAAKASAIFGDPYEDDARIALTGAESSGNLDLHIGNLVHDSVLLHVKASVAVIQGRFEAGLEIYRSLLPRIDAQGFGDTEAHTLADMAWCFVNLGDDRSARDYAMRATEAHQDSDHVEDQAAELGRLSQVYRALGDGTAEREFTAKAKSALDAYRLLQLRFLKATASLDFPSDGFKIEP